VDYKGNSKDVERVRGPTGEILFKKARMLKDVHKDLVDTGRVVLVECRPNNVKSTLARGETSTCIVGSRCNDNSHMRLLTLDGIICDGRSPFRTPYFRFLHKVSMALIIAEDSEMMRTLGEARRR
jgi:hypothetical protein